MIRDSLVAIAWMATPVCTGFALWRFVLASRSGGGSTAERVGRVLSRCTILGSVAPLMVLVFWKTPLPDGGTLLLPLVGLSVHVIGSTAGWAVARATGQRPSSRAAFFLSGGSSNVLTFGGITVVLLLRSASDPFAERAIGTMALYRLFESPYYFLIAWPLAATIAHVERADGGSWRATFVRALKNPSLVPVACIFVGWTLNASGVDRPALFDGVAGILVKVNVVTLGLVVGFGLRRAAPIRHARQCLAIAAIKFALMPGIAVGLASLCGFPPETLRVVLICSSMPVAFMALIGATIHRIEIELVGSFWVFTTAAMPIVVPLLALAVRAIGR